MHTPPVSAESVRTALDASIADDRTLLLRATAQELGPTRDAVLDTVTTRAELSRKQAVDADHLICPSCAAQKIREQLDGRI